MFYKVVTSNLFSNYKCSNLELSKKVVFHIVGCKRPLDVCSVSYSTRKHFVGNLTTLLRICNKRKQTSVV